MYGMSLVVGLKMDDEGTMLMARIATGTTTSVPLSSAQLQT